MRLIALALALVPVFSLAAPQRFEASTFGSLTVEPDGRVSEVTLDARLKPPFRSAFEDAIRRWQFQPIVQDGHPIRAVGHMSLTLFLETDRSADSVRAGFERVDFVDAPEDQRMSRAEMHEQGLRLRPPQYPVGVAMAGVGGELMMLVEVDEQGEVLRAEPQSASLFVSSDSRPSAVEDAYEQLAKATRRAAMRWKLPNLEERTALVPVVFSAPGQTSDFWRPIYDVAIVPQPWMLTAGEACQLTASGERESERLRLVQPVEGTEVARSGG
jgi:hypothetical protein